jgi:Leucine-rich repeat (LRR) protein
LGNLSSLRHYDIAKNNLVGNIPNALGRLKNFLVFNAGGNRLSGMIPPSLYNISSIKVISTIENRLKGTLPENIGLTLPNIQFFGIGFNEFSGPIPISLSNASQLQILDLPANNFVGKVPTDLGNLVDRWFLSFASNNLGSNSTYDLGFLASLKNCSKLVELEFRFSNFGGFIPSSIANLSTQLNYLSISGNQLSGKIPAALGNLFNLFGLELDDKLFMGVIPTDFGRFQKKYCI